MVLHTDAPHDRHLELPNVFNFRDLGGYRTADGHSVKWRTLFRADGVHRMAAADVTPLGLRTVIDLRTHGEIDERGSFAAEGIDYHHLPLIPQTWEAADVLPDGDAAGFLAARYLEMLDLGGGHLGDALRLFADRRALPAVFHCAAGKDRTGVVAAITLALLGVADGAIAADYALSAAATERWTAMLVAERPEIAKQIAAQPTVFLESPVEAMLLFLASVRERWGSVPACVASLGVEPATIEALRANLLD